MNFALLCSSCKVSGVDEHRIFRVSQPVDEQWILNGYYDEERHRRYDSDKNTLLRAYVSSIGYIVHLKWIEYEDKPFSDRSDSYYQSICDNKRIRKKLRQRSRKGRTHKRRLAFRSRRQLSHSERC